MQGRRVDPDVSYDDFEPGDYQVLESAVWLRLPTGSLAHLNTAEKQGTRDGRPVWGLEEHDDGTITLEPSILQEAIPAMDIPAWHGFLRRGVWTTA